MAKKTNKAEQLQLAIIKTLKAGYNELNLSGTLPDIQAESELVPIAGHIIVGLQRLMAEQAENDQYEGMSYEEIVAQKKQIHENNLKALQEKAQADLKKLKAAKESRVQEEPEDEHLEGDLDPSDEPDPGIDPDSEHGGEPEQDGEPDPGPATES
ncbi:hypothetical protein CLV98_1531 [Dyadobacter jejuensis]|uniref:Uncharacterized protein n=1 Tax=Dyadobacter jejuensis TaxID=1082580 RepID=A0A315ZT55_9BACT|nr:hypothetical protein [Dyadobacter jejuensis]PWJ48479.1 hypothetical protein CLV98_1531 [Dyadobacter jejuensis]